MAAGGETANFDGRVALHHAVIADDVAYGSWRDGGLTLLDVKDKTKPKLISHRNWRPPFAGGTHSALPLHDRDLVIVADEAVRNIDVEPLKYTWVIDIRAPENPVTIATMPTPSDQDYFRKPGHFGPHNLWENRPEGYQSSRYVSRPTRTPGCAFSTSRTRSGPRSMAGSCRRRRASSSISAPTSCCNCTSADVYVEKNGLAYMTDFNAGLSVVEIDGV